MKVKSLEFKIFLAAAMVLFGICALPCFGNFAVSVAEKYLGRTLRDAPRWMEVVMHCSFIGIFVVLITVFLSFVPLGKKIAGYIKNEYGLFHKELKMSRVIFVSAVVFVFYLLCFSRIILADFFYHDDIWRAAEGSRSWIGLGRYVSEFLSILIHNNIEIQDIATLPQIISVFIMSFTTVLLTYILNGKKIDFIPALALTPVFISPFFAQNFSYRYDCVYMVIAVLLPVIPFLFRDNIPAFVFSSIVFLILDCMSYQAGTSVYIILAIFFVASKIISYEVSEDLSATSPQEKKKLAVFLGASVVSFAIALVLYKILFVNSKSFDPNFYADAQISVTSIIPNTAEYIELCAKDFGGFFTKFSFAVVSVLAIILCVKNSKCNKFFAFVVAVAAYILGLIFSFGSYLVFKQPLYEPRAFMGFNCFVAVVCFVLVKQVLFFEKNSRLIKCIFVPVLLYGCMVFLFTLGNCMSVQKKYQSFRMSVLMSDLDDFIVSDKDFDLTFSGTIGMCNGNEIAVKNYPVIRKLVTVLPSANSIWNDDLMKFHNIEIEENSSAVKPEWPLLRSTVYHDIYAQNNHFHVVLKEEF